MLGLSSFYRHLARQTSAVLRSRAWFGTTPTPLHRSQPPLRRQTGHFFTFNQLKNVQMFGCRILDPDGSFIHWPDINVHLDWNQFLQAVEPAELHKAQQRSTGFNRRYGAAIRKLREKAGIPQAKVAGITERQLRRIEQGECRATMNALRDPAKAHGLDVNIYYLYGGGERDVLSTPTKPLRPSQDGRGRSLLLSGAFRSPENGS